MTQKASPSSAHASDNYQAFLVEVKARIRTAQYEALKAVNKELVGLYWDLGRMIEAYIDLEKLAPWVREIGWSHNLGTLKKQRVTFQGLVVF